MSDRRSRIAVTCVLMAAALLLSPNVLERVRAQSTGWSAPVLLETEGGDAQHPQVSMDRTGNATVVWFQWNGSRNEIRANRFEPAAGWRGAEILSNETSPDGLEPWSAMGPRSEALVAWEEWDGSVYNIAARGNNPTIGWGTAVVLWSTVGWPLYHPRVAIDPSGAAQVVWEGWDGTGSRIYSARYAPETGWEPSAPLGPTGSDAHYPEIAVDPQGNAIAAWYAGGARADVWASRYRPGFGWATPVLLDTSSAGDAFNPLVAMDAQGNGIVVWQQYDGTRWGVWAARYDASAGWLGVTQLDDKAGDAEAPRIAVSPLGFATAVWSERTSGRSVIWASRFNPAVGWSGPETVSEALPWSGSAPQITLDDLGRSSVIWTQVNGTASDIYASRAGATGGWEAPVRISSGTLISRAPRLAANEQGSAIAVWEEAGNGPANVWAALFTPPTPATNPPSSSNLSLPTAIALVAIGVLVGMLLVLAFSRRRRPRP